jgi:hypothetical protein
VPSSLTFASSTPEMSQLWAEHRTVAYDPFWYCFLAYFPILKKLSRLMRSRYCACVCVSPYRC